MLSDLSRVLREEERSAWQRLVRVLSHEINNSLAPIKSIAGSLRTLAGRASRPADWEQDLSSGLTVIESRSESLGRFMAAYARLARLPQPQLGRVDVGDWVRRVAALETRLPVQVAPGPDVSVTADGDQLDQLLINLVRNARRRGARDRRRRAGRVAHRRAASSRCSWRMKDPAFPIPATCSCRSSPPRPTARASASPLSRQIAEAHGGSLLLEGRRGTKGARARLRLPLGPA